MEQDRINLTSHPVFALKEDNLLLNQFLLLPETDLESFKELSGKLESRLALESGGEKLELKTSIIESISDSESLAEAIGEIRLNMGDSTQIKNTSRKWAWEEDIQLEMPELERVDFKDILQTMQDFTIEKIMVSDVYNSISNSEFWPSVDKAKKKKKLKRKSKMKSGDFKGIVFKEALQNFLPIDQNGHDSRVLVLNDGILGLTKVNSDDILTKSDSQDTLLQDGYTSFIKDDGHESMKLNLQDTLSDVMLLIESDLKTAMVMENLEPSELVVSNVLEEKVGDMSVDFRASNAQEDLQNSSIDSIALNTNGSELSRSPNEVTRPGHADETCGVSNEFNSEIKDSVMDHLESDSPANVINNYSATDCNPKNDLNSSGKSKNISTVLNDHVQDSNQNVTQKVAINNKTKSTGKKKNKKEKQKKNRLSPKITSQIFKQLQPPAWSQSIIEDTSVSYLSKVGLPKSTVDDTSASYLSKVILPETTLDDMIRAAPMLNDPPMPEYEWNLSPDSPPPQSFYDQEEYGYSYPGTLTDVGIQVTPRSNLSFANEEDVEEFKECDSQETFPDSHNNPRKIDRQFHTPSPSITKSMNRDFVSTAIHPSDYRKYGLMHPPPPGYTYIYTLGYVPMSNMPYPIYILAPLSELDPELQKSFDADSFDILSAQEFLSNRWEAAQNLLAVIRERDLNLLTPEKSAWISFCSFSK